MIRDLMGEMAYWDLRITKDLAWISKAGSLLREPSKNPVYDPQFTFDLAKDAFRVMVRRYSRGDNVAELGEHFPGLLDAWELSNRLAVEICAEHKLKTCRDWILELCNLNYYNWCFWLVGMALALEIPDEQWQRLLALIGGEGEDALLDQVISSRQSGRVIGNRVLHPKPYARLLKAIDASKDQQASLLREFVDRWYAELARKGKEELWWYIYGEPEKNSLEKGSYFGRWCIEAVAAVKAFGLDDSLCLGHEHYPGDLLRPSGPSTHPARPKPKKGWLSRLFN